MPLALALQLWLSRWGWTKSWLQHPEVPSLVDGAAVRVPKGVTRRRHGLSLVQSQGVVGVLEVSDVAAILHAALEVGCVRSEESLVVRHVSVRRTIPESRL